MILLRNPRKFAYTAFQKIPDIENFWKFKQEFLVKWKAPTFLTRN